MSPRPSARSIRQSTIFWLGVCAAAMPLPGLGAPAQDGSTPLLMDSRFSGFDTIAHVRNRVPALEREAETISHWAGYYSVNPLLLARLAEREWRRNWRDGLTVRELARRLNRAAAGERAGEVAGVADRSRAVAGFLAVPAGDVEALLQLTNSDMLAAGIPMTHALADDQPPALDLPFAKPQAWQFNGVHTWSGDDNGNPMSSLDFTSSWGQDWGSDTSEDWVAAAHDGEVTVFSSCYVQVQHPGGWGTRYYHLDNVAVATGQRVQAGEVLANYADNRDQALCSGGHSTGPHVHFALMRDGRYTSLQDVALSGYKVHPGDNSYDSHHDRMWLEKRGVRYYGYGEHIATEPGDNTIDYRYNGMWYAPAHDGHGMNIEITEEPDGEGSRKTVFVVLFTYDDAGDANFYVGNIDFGRWRSDERQQVDLLQMSGGDLSNLAAIDFGDPEQVMPAGQADILFEDCNTVRVDLQLLERTSGQAVEHALELLRLIGVPSHVCEAASLPLPE